MTFGIASAFPTEFGLTRGVDAQRPQGTWYAPGPYVQAEAAEPAHPLFYGLRGKTLPVRWAEGPLLQVAGSESGDWSPSPAPPRTRPRCCCASRAATARC